MHQSPIKGWVQEETSLDKRYGIDNFSVTRAEREKNIHGKFTCFVALFFCEVRAGNDSYEHLLFSQHVFKDDHLRF